MVFSKQIEKNTLLELVLISFYTPSHEIKYKAAAFFLFYGASPLASVWIANINSPNCREIADTAGGGTCGIRLANFEGFQPQQVRTERGAR